jgi:hypothetical protein
MTMRPVGSQNELTFTTCPCTTAAESRTRSLGVILRNVEAPTGTAAAIASNKMTDTRRFMQTSFIQRIADHRRSADPRG